MRESPLPRRRSTCPCASSSSSSSTQVIPVLFHAAAPPRYTTPCSSSSAPPIRGDRRGRSDNRQRFCHRARSSPASATRSATRCAARCSSIPGAAVTQVRFDDALHEFTTLTGVTEDVTDIILNLKDLVLVRYSDEPVTLRLDAKGAGAITAADIEAQLCQTSTS